MQKLFLSITLFASLFIACKKEDVVQPESSVSSERAIPVQVGIPTSFTQKLLIEMMSSAYCATCPDAETKFRNIAAAHPGRVFGIGIHDADAMEIPLYDFMDSVFTIPYYASGMLNRTPFGGMLVLPKGNWNANINTCLNKTASCGLKINSSLTGNTATVEVYAGFNAAITGDCRLTVYLFEDSVTGIGSGYNQSNYYNNTVSSPYYQLGNPIIGYQHDFVARRVLTAHMGDLINVSFSHRSCGIKKSFVTNINGYNAAKLYVIAFINKVGSTNMTHEILNVQQTKLGTNKDFD